MSYNGSGTFNINSAGQPVVSGTVISSTAFNALTADLATGLTTALTKNGQTTPTANITLGGYKITNLAAGTAAADAVRFDQLTGAGVPLITVAGTADAITGTITPSLTAYTTGGLFSFVVGSTNTTAVTLNIDGLGAKAVTRTGSVALVAGDMVTGQVVLVEYDGTRFQLLNGNSFTNLKVSGTLGVTGLTTLGVTGAVFPGSTSGTATIVAPAVAGTPTLTLPTLTGTVGLATRTVQVFTSGSGTYTTPTGCKAILVQIVGGGGGGGGNENGAAGSNGGNTTFSTLTAGYGSGGKAGATGGTAVGGSATGGDVNIAGGGGGGAYATANSGTPGGTGGNSALGGGGPGGFGATGVAGATNSGSGGGGGGGNGATRAAGGGGGSGGYVQKLIASPSATYSYAVGAGGAAGAGGDTNAGAGAAGIVIVTESY